MNRIRLRGWHALVLGGVVLGLGCSQGGEAGTYPVTGKVTQNNQPVAGASISFVPSAEGGSAAASKTDADGQYTVNAVPGAYNVMLVKYESSDDSAGDDESMESAEYEAAQAAEAAQGDDYEEDPSSGNLLPDKFASPATSGLTHTVTEGSTTFDINLDE